LIHRAIALGILVDVTPELQDQGMCILQYVDDTLFQLKECEENAENLKTILCIF
jgi:hypothetical protein